MLLAKLIKLYCILRYGPSKLYLKVYRVSEDQGRFTSRSIVFENTQCQRFIQNQCYGEPFDNRYPDGDRSNQIGSLNDAISAIETLKIEMPLDLHSDSWDSEGSESIDQAINESRAKFEKLRARGATDGFTESSAESKNKGGKKIHAFLKVEEMPVKETPFEEEIRQLSDTLRRKAGAKSVHWKSIGFTPAGRECQVLMIDGREQHRVP